MSKSRPKFLLTMLGILVILGVAAFLVAAQSKDPPPVPEGKVYQTGPGDPPVPVIDPVQRTDRGEKHSDGSCQYTVDLEREAGDNPVYGRVISEDIANCTRTVEEGEVSVADADRLTGEASSSPGQILAAGFGASTVHKARLKVWYEDIVQIDLNRVEATVKWTVSDSGVHYYSTGSGCDEWHRSSTGWKDKGGNCSWRYKNSQTKVEQKADRYFTNTVWPCPSPVTGTYVRYVWVIAGGVPNGGSYSSHSTRKWGNCASWVHENYVFYP